jgi:hypothetical protein
MSVAPLGEMFGRLIRADRQGRAAKTVETVGWLLDRPLVPVVVAILWYMNSIPGALALAFAVEDFGSFLWTLSAWRGEVRTAQSSWLAVQRIGRSGHSAREV